MRRLFGRRRIINKTNTLRIVYTRGVFMLYRKRCKRKFVLLKKILLSVVLLIIGVTVFCEVHLSDFRPEYIRIQAEILSVNSVCDAVNKIHLTSLIILTVILQRLIVIKTEMCSLSKRIHSKSTELKPISRKLSKRK